LDLCRLAQACSTMVARFKGFLLDLSYRSFILIGPIRAEYRTIIPNGLKKLSPDCRNKAQNDMGLPTLSSSVPLSLFFSREDLPQGGLSHSRRLHGSYCDALRASRTPEVTLVGVLPIPNSQTAYPSCLVETYSRYVPSRQKLINFLPFPRALCF
jgi:hypothetical protein